MNGAHSTDGGGGGREGHQRHMNAPPLPVVRPAPVAAAAGESPTAAAPLPAVYGYTPEQRVGTERQGSGTRKERFTEPDESRSSRTAGKMTELVGGEEKVTRTRLSMAKGSNRER